MTSLAHCKHSKAISIDYKDRRSSNTSTKCEMNGCRKV